MMDLVFITRQPHRSPPVSRSRLPSLTEFRFAVQFVVKTCVRPLTAVFSGVKVLADLDLHALKRTPRSHLMT